MLIKALQRILVGLVVVSLGTVIARSARAAESDEAETSVERPVWVMPMALDATPAALLVWPPPSGAEAGPEPTFDELTVDHPFLVPWDADEASLATVRSAAEELAAFSGTLEAALDVLADWGFQRCAWNEYTSAEQVKVAVDLGGGTQGAPFGLPGPAGPVWPEWPGWPECPPCMHWDIQCSPCYAWGGPDDPPTYCIIVCVKGCLNGGVCCNSRCCGEDETCCRGTCCNMQDCDTACDQVDDQGHAGGVVCCCGEKMVCIWDQNIDPWYSDPAIKKCLRPHEEDHFDDISCSGCAPDRPPFDDPSGPNINAEECSAHQVELNCLQGELETCEQGGGDCTDISIRITIIECRVDVFCNPPPPPDDGPQWEASEACGCHHPQTPPCGS